MIVDEYVRDGYALETDSDTRAVLSHKDNGSLLAHLALFFTFGWLTLGLLNLAYVVYRRRKSADRVEVVVDE